ncbi:MAG: DUF2147 domain-containing protein [Bacteroidetes bacterium]|nr:DUF2147 domain-containing protein [Bacteroidota bacterium]
MILFFTLSLNVVSHGQDNESIIGKWKTIDDETGKEKSVVEIYQKNDGKYYGKIIKLFRKEGEDPDPVCDKCDEDDARYNKKILGMEIVTALEKNEDNEYEDGEILDPKKGKVYDCKLWIENGKLQVRGYVLFFHRTQEWLKYTEEKAPVQ